MQPTLKLVESPDTETIEMRGMTITDQASALSIEDKATYERGAEILLLIKDAMKEIDATFGPIKTKAHATWKEIVAQEKRHQEPLLQAEASIKSKISTYVMAEEKKRREEEAKAMALLKKQEEEKRLAMAVEAENLDLSDAVDSILEKPSFVPPVILETQAPKVKGVSMSMVWKFEIEDEKLVPDQFKMIDETKIRKLVSAMGGEARIPGVRIFQVPNVSAGRR